MIDSNALIEMMESSFDGVWITDGEGKVLFANSANASLLGVSKAELEGRTTQQLLFIFLLGRGVDIAGDALSIDDGGVALPIPRSFLATAVLCISSVT